MDKVIFLDRDGVINKDPGGWTKYGYVTKWEDFHFLPGALDALKKLKSHGYDIIVISNQAGINKGHFSESTLKTINNNMLREIDRHGGVIKAVYYCIHTSEDNCSCRKPKTGFFNKASKDFGINPKGKYFIGDGVTDIEAGLKAGCKTIFVTCGKATLEDVEKANIKPFRINKNLSKAVDWIVENE